MSKPLNISGEKFAAPQALAKRFGYSNAYIVLLAREGKVKARKVGNRWYIESTSVERFFKKTGTVKELRAEQMRKDRIAELKTHERTRLKRGAHTRALVETLVILVLGISIGAMGYLGTTTTTPQSASALEGSAPVLERIALTLSSFLAPQSTEPTRKGIMTGVSTSSISAPKLSATPKTSLVVGPATVMTTSTVESIRGVFSDDVSVSVSPNDPDTGVIIPHFRSRNGETYRFVMVPVFSSGTQ